MEFQEYKNVLMETIINSYPLYFQKTLLKNFEQNNLVFRDGRKTNSNNLLDLTHCSGEKAQLGIALKNIDKTINYCEEFEYDKGYRYCTIFKFHNYDKNVISKLITQGEIIEYKEESISNDKLYSFMMKPTYKETEKYIFLKFNFLLISRDDSSDRVKYPILVVMHKSLNVIEIRLDTVSFKYKSRENFYEDKIGSVRAWLVSNLKLKIEDIDFQAVTKYMKDNKYNEVTITAMKMVREGMIANLDACSNEEMTIPILGELKKLMIKLEPIFIENKYTLKIQTLLNDFIREIDETSDLPSVKIFWHRQRIKLSVTHSYKEKGYSLFKYCDELENKERMNYVTDYLINCEGEIKKQLGIE